MSIGGSVPALADIFASRPDRFRMLENGLGLTGWEQGLLLLEVGCGRADGAAYLAKRLGVKVTGTDLNAALFQEAGIRHAALLEQGLLTLLCADAQRLPFKAESYDGIFSEAAFSPLADKEAMLRCCRNSLKFGGRLLINDFCVKSREDLEYCGILAHIPCFSGVNSLERYLSLCKHAGFRILHSREDYGEMIRLAMCISKAYCIKVEDIEPYLSGYFHSGRSRCRGTDAGCREDFHRQARLSYCQIVLIKE